MQWYIHFQPEREKERNFSFKVYSIYDIYVYIIQLDRNSESIKFLRASESSLMRKLAERDNSMKLARLPLTDVQPASPTPPWEIESFGNGWYNKKSTASPRQNLHPRKIKTIRNYFSTRLEFIVECCYENYRKARNIEEQ